MLSLGTPLAFKLLFRRSFERVYILSVDMDALKHFAHNRLKSAYEAVAPDPSVSQFEEKRVRAALPCRTSRCADYARSCLPLHCLKGLHSGSN